MRDRGLQFSLDQGSRDSAEHKALMRAIEKAHGDREQAIKNVCRLYAAKNFDALPAHVRALLRSEHQV